MKRRHRTFLRRLAALLAMLLLFAAVAGCAASSDGMQPDASGQTHPEAALPAAGQTVLTEPNAAPDEPDTTPTGSDDHGPAAPTVSATPACTISVNCAAVLDNADLCEPGTLELIPADGWMLAPVTVEFTDGESAFDVLLRACRERKIHLEYSETPVYSSVYLEGIGNLYEFDCGSLSGWTYRVNGEFPNYSCSGYMPRDGDVIEWIYTCDLGADVGQ